MLFVSMGYLDKGIYSQEIEERRFSGYNSRQYLPKSHERTYETGIAALRDAIYKFLAKYFFCAEHMSSPFHSVHTAHLGLATVMTVKRLPHVRIIDKLLPRLHRQQQQVAHSMQRRALTHIHCSVPMLRILICCDQTEINLWPK